MDSAKASLALGNKLFPWLLLVVSGGEEKQPESGDWVCKGLATLSEARSAATSLAGGGGGRLRRLRSASASLCWLVDTKCACQAICNSGELNIVGRSTPRGRTLSPEVARESGPPSGSPAAELGLNRAGGRSAVQVTIRAAENQNIRESPARLVNTFNCDRIRKGSSSIRK